MKEIAAEELLQHAEFVRRVARALGNHSSAADDIAQDTWLTALTRKRPNAPGLRGWLGGVARNVARQDRREASRRRVREAAAASNEAQPATDEVVERMETHQRVVAAILELSEGSRQVVVLHYFEGLPPRKIASRLGLPVETVRTRLKRARQRLRQKLDESFGSSKACLAALSELARSGMSGTANPNGNPAGASTAAIPTIGKVSLTGAVTAAAGLAVWPLLANPTEETRVTPSRIAQTPRTELGIRASVDPAEAATAAGSEGGRAPVAAGPLARPLPEEPSGLLVVRDVDGVELRGKSGELLLVPLDGASRGPLKIPVRDGHFSLRGFSEGSLRVERAYVTADGEHRPVAFEQPELELTADEPLFLHGRLLRESTLRVVNAHTGEELRGVRVLPGQGRAGQRHPGPHYSSSFCVTDEASPVRLPWAQSIRPYWVTAQGYTWSHLSVDHDNGGERVVRLEPAGRLGVHAEGHDPSLAIFLRVYEHESQELAAACTLDEGPAFQGFDGIPAGTYDVRAEIGSAGESPRVLDEARVVIPAGGVADVYLEPSARDVPQAVSVRGELVLPAGHEELGVSLRILPAEGPVLRRWDTDSISHGTMGLSDSGAGVRTWYAERLTPGRYLFIVDPIQYGVLVEVPPNGADDVRIEVPALFPVVVRAIDARTGRTVADAEVRWARAMPADAGHDAWTEVEFEQGSRGTTLLAPTGSISLSAAGPTHGEAVAEGFVGSGTTEFTLELPRRIPLEVVLECGDTVIPWEPGMTCAYRPLGTRDTRTLGSFAGGRGVIPLDEPGLYEIVVGPGDGFFQPDPVTVGVDESTNPAVVVPLQRRR